MRQRWHLSGRATALVLVAFSLAGMTVASVGRPAILALLPPTEPDGARWLARILLVAAGYQIVLLGYGAMLGQFRFFWEREKRIGQRIWALIIPQKRVRRHPRRHT